MIKFDEFELDFDRYQLRRAGKGLKLEKMPMELLILLATKNGHLVTRAEIVDRLWGKEVFVDTEGGINTLVRKVRQALRDDSEQPRFIETVTGKGYRFIAAVTILDEPPTRESSAAAIAHSNGSVLEFRGQNFVDRRSWHFGHRRKTQVPGRSVHETPRTFWLEGP